MSATGFVEGENDDRQGVAAVIDERKARPRAARTCSGLRCASRMPGTSARPKWRAASNRPWPAISSPSSVTNSGTVQP